jgi:predicted lipoprotein with Yx(FWY)xxD motif
LERFLDGWRLVLYDPPKRSQRDVLVASHCADPQEPIVMKRNRIASSGLVALLAGFALLVVAVSASSAEHGRPRTAGRSSVGVRLTPLGKILVDSRGRTLYLFKGDRPNVSTLSRAGLIVWPAFTSTGTPRAAGGAKATSLATIIARGGRRQVTYNRHPLYYYVGDQAPGETHGQGLNQFGGLWYVLAPSGNAITSAPRTAPVSQYPNVGY